MAQSVERRIGSAEVTGPIPVSSFIFLPKIKGLLKIIGITLDIPWICGHTIIVTLLYIQRGDIMRCLNCKNTVGLFEQVCPYCGNRMYDDQPVTDKTVQNNGMKRKGIFPVFSEEECFLMGIHPDDEMYRKIMELNILSKDYK